MATTAVSGTAKWKPRTTSQTLQRERPVLILPLSSPFYPLGLYRILPSPWVAWSYFSTGHQFPHWGTLGGVPEGVLGSVGATG